MEESAKELTPRQFKAIPKLLTGRTVAEGCEAARIGKTTLYKWRKNSHFMQEYTRQRRALIQDAYAVLERSIEKAASELAGLLDSGNERVKRLAAVNILDLHSKYVSSEELEMRINEIEKRLEIES